MALTFIPGHMPWIGLGPSTSLPSLFPYHPGGYGVSGSTINFSLTLPILNLPGLGQVQ